MGPVGTSLLFLLSYFICYFISRLHAEYVAVLFYFILPSVLSKYDLSFFLCFLLSVLLFDSWNFIPPFFFFFSNAAFRSFLALINLKSMQVFALLTWACI